MTVKRQEDMESNSGLVYYSIQEGPAIHQEFDHLSFCGGWHNFANKSGSEDEVL